MRVGRGPLAYIIIGFASAFSARSRIFHDAKSRQAAWPSDRPLPTAAAAGRNSDPWLSKTLAI
jgi:hypothetical protein